MRKVIGNETTKSRKMSQSFEHLSERASVVSAQEKQENHEGEK